MGIYKKKNYTDCEILAPAGSYPCMVAAFHAGADAVYVGGAKFGARAYADNFDTEELKAAIDYAHLRGKRLYLTVNTLLKERELTEELFSYIAPLYEAGLDAVIVQDMGVLRKIHQDFPELAIHASTQMSVMGPLFAEELKSLGVTRIVTPRELSLREITAISDETGMEIESFIHGALCYSYSGKCLMSSMIGGRSGNRGRCAQPCRLKYRTAEKTPDKYLLSPKDMCTLKLLPEILKAGVYSLKIEGRMKKPEYVAGVVKAYRKYVDILKEGEPYDVRQEDIEELGEIYNRGGFTDGYYKRHNGREMMSLYKPNHYGVQAGRLEETEKGVRRVRVLKDIDERDVLEVNLKDNTSITLQNHGSLKAGECFVIKQSLKKADLYEDGVYRTRNHRLIEELKGQAEKEELKAEIKGHVCVRENTPMSLRAELVVQRTGEESRTAEYTSYGSMPERAKSRPLTEEELADRLKKTGNTDFVFIELSIELSEGLFVPMAALNELRRECLQGLRDKALELLRRKPATESGAEAVRQGTSDTVPLQRAETDCVVSDREQLDLALQKEFITAIALEWDSFSGTEREEYLSQIKEKGKKAYIALPYICRCNVFEYYESHAEFFTSDLYDGLLVRDYEEYFFFRKMFETCSLSNKKTAKNIIFDSGIYLFNSATADYERELLERCGGEGAMSLPYELNVKELRELLKAAGNPGDFRMEVYGYIPLMVSANCVKKTTLCCERKSEAPLILQDRKNNRMTVLSHCKSCYNILLNSVPLCLLKEMKTLMNMGIKRYSIRFTIEDEGTVRDILDKTEAALNGDLQTVEDMEGRAYTRGHFRRGVM